MAPRPYPYWVALAVRARRRVKPNGKRNRNGGKRVWARNPREGMSVGPQAISRSDFPMAAIGTDDEAARDRIRTISRHSLAYMLCAASEMFRHYDFDPMDLILIHAILNANVLNIMKNPKLDRQLGSVETVEPDAIKRSSRVYPEPRLLVSWACRSKPSGGAPIG
jgi:hypothetical protein